MASKQVTTSLTIDLITAFSDPEAIVKVILSISVAMSEFVCG